MKQCFATKSIDHLNQSADPSGLRRALGALDLILLGIGAIIGTGIFVLTGRAAAINAGPSVAISFGIAMLAASLAALCYAEMASIMPVAGSAYTYTYVTMGELAAWLMGWDLMLEYVLGAAAVSVGWSGYAAAFVKHTWGWNVPLAWTTPPLHWDHVQHHFEWTGAYLNLPAVGISLLLTCVLLRGIRQTARFNAVSVAAKLGTLLLFIACATPWISPHNWVPFVPENTGSFGQFGYSGIMQAASMVFFCYIGFDAIASTAQETQHPQRDLPIGILVSLMVCTVLYMAVALVLTGVVPYPQLGVPNPMSVGVGVTGHLWLQVVVEIGALVGLTSVLLVNLLGQTRVFYAMAQDGLLPPLAAQIHPRFGTPHVTTVVSGIACAGLGGVFPVEVLGELMSIGTLFAFVWVSVGVILLRHQRPDLPRRFRVPGGTYLIPSLSILVCTTLILTATPSSIYRLILWILLGVVTYACYGYWHSKLRKA